MRPDGRTLALALSAALAACGAVALADAPEPHAIDIAKSRAQFRIAHIFVSHVTGTIPILSGSVKLSAGSLIPLEVEAVLDAAHVDSGDRDRDASLEGADYFDTQKFPTWSFASTKIVATGPSAFAMDGNLTIHGVAQPEHLDVSVTGDAVHPAYRATGRIDRHAFGMRGARLDPVIGKDADVTLEITLAH
jgi:polyisoprenoid-binding protein YceI